MGSNKWIMYPILVQGVQVKVYVNQANDRAVVFPLFGRYFQLSSDQGVLDFAADFLLNRHRSNVVSFASYLNQFEDTARIELDKVA